MKEENIMQSGWWVLPNLLWIKGCRKTGLYTGKSSSGRTINQTEDHFEVTQSIRNHGRTAIQTNLIELHTKTTFAWIHFTGCLQKLDFTWGWWSAAHWRECLDFAQFHHNWTDAESAAVMFSGECRINLYGSKIQAWRKPGEQYTQYIISPYAQFSGDSVMMRGGGKQAPRIPWAIFELQHLHTKCPWGVCTPICAIYRRHNFQADHARNILDIPRGD